MINLKKSELYNPAPLEYDESTKNYLWIIKDYRIWASSYQEALKHLEIIERI